MVDRLLWLLKSFELRARVFQSGPLCQSAEYDAQNGLGYIHVLQRGVLRVETAAQSSLLLDEPSLFLYMNPTRHRLLPEDSQVEMVCASFEFGAGWGNPLARALSRNGTDLSIRQVTEFTNLLASHGARYL